MKVVLLAVLAVLFLAAPAQAGWKLNRAAQIANIVWGNPCPWRIEWAPPPPRHPEAVAWAVQDECGDTGKAVVYLSETEPIHTFDVFCTRVLHERGHSIGMEHSGNPRSVMYGVDQSIEGRYFRDSTHFTWRGHGDRRCRDRGRPFLERYGLLSRRTHVR